MAACICLVTCGAEEPKDAPKDSPLKNVKPVENSEAKLGDQIHKTSDGLRDLLDEIQQNIVKIQDEDHVKGATTKLDHVSTKMVGDVVDALVAARKGGTPKEGLKNAINGQDEVIKELRALLRKMQGQLNPEATHKLLDAAIKKQEEAMAKTKETRVRKDLEGKPTARLTEDDKKALTETNDKQKEATEELDKALSELKQEAEAAKKDTPALAENIEKAEQKLQQAGAKEKSNEAQNDINENKLRAAEQKEAEVLAALREADKQLAQNTDKIDQLEKNIADLKKTREKQAETQKETKNLDTKNDQAVAQAAKDQGEVSKALDDLKKDNPELAPTEKNSETAAADIGENKPREAVGEQQKVLEALDQAIAKADKDLANAQNQNDATAQAQENLNKIQELRQQQQELKNQTDKADNQQANALAPKENNLAQQTGDVAQQTDQALQAPLQEAKEAMQQAAKDLANQAPKEAAKQEAKALQALDKAEAQALAELAQADPNAADQALANEIGELQQAEQGLQDATAEGKGEPHAAEQGELGNHAHELGNQPGPAHAGLEQAAQAMQQAAQAMQQGQQAQAAQAQAQAQAALKQAQQALGQAMAEAHDPSNNPDNHPPPPKSVSKEHKAGQGNFTYGKMANLDHGAWNVMLPPKERDAVEQGVKSNVPPKYARQIKLYYQNMAGSRGGE
jgi:hypothetical protein